MAALEKPAETVVDDANPPTANRQRREAYTVFSGATKIYLTYFLGFTMILSTLTATIYFPLIPMLGDQFNVSIQAINLTITVYAIVQAVSPGIFASVADSFGRRPVLLLLVALYALGSLGLALNKNNYAALIALRALQSIGGSAIPTLAYGIAADVAPTAERGRMLGPMLSTCNGISAVGPVIGGAITLGTSGIQWVFWALLIISALCFLVAGFTLPETARCVVGNGSKPAVGIWKTWWSLTRRKSEKTEPASENSCAGVIEREKWRPLTALASLRIIFYKDASAVLWMVALTYSIYYTFQVAIPVIFADIYSYNELEIGLAFLPGLAGMTIGGIIAGKLVDLNYAVVAKKHNFCTDSDRRSLGDFPIEAARYRNCLVFVIGETILVIGYGWAVHYQVHPAAPIVLQFFICAASTLLSHTASALLVDIFPEKSSTAYASGQIMRCGVSAASAAVLQPLVNVLGYGWYFTLFALFVGVFGVISVFISRLKGMHWRQKRCSW
ncbi:MFS general substrate transporter [Hypoxylon trugodes]|uniref:MFS general substrate transporter n=1 Tax=Hypoxylon trugodes TaxID=326681 RepID=UPI00218E895A|nr:MFS general substrate transporter [Hypoxylon trugodes]KAI1383415.1 MFS general substrate transporter [Hypoxylon trugodes]